MNLGCVLTVVARMCRCCVMVLAAVLSVEAYGDIKQYNHNKNNWCPVKKTKTRKNIKKPNAN